MVAANRRRTSTSTSVFGSRILGPPDQPGGRLNARTQLLLTTAAVVANLVGAVAVTAIATGLHGGVARFREAGVLLLDIVLVPTYALVALIVGVIWGTVRVRRQLEWVRTEAPPDPHDVRMALRVPIQLTRIQAVLWGLAVVVFGLINGLASVQLGLEVALHVAIGGAVVCAVAYLLSEFVMRPVAARALAHHVPDRPQLPGVTARQLLAWGLGVLPVVGLLTIGVSALAREDLGRVQLAVAILVLGGTTLLVGGLLALLSARATADPVKGLRQALARLDAGDLDVEVPVYDGTEIGLLQAGFNRAVAGLRERQRIRDLFGRHVGEEVARAALAGDTELGGQEVEVAVLFVDVIGSTALAAERAPHEVVAVLNQFFGVAVDVVEEFGGYVDKFAGDAVLAVFGAPVPMEDAPRAALQAARRLAERLATEVTECEAGIGVAAGPAIAGNVGHPRRLEYTVIGDAVNEAARLSDLAKQLPPRVAASMRAVQAAGDEAAHWRSHGEVELRGRAAPTHVAVPQD